MCVQTRAARIAYGSLITTLEIQRWLGGAEAVCPGLQDSADGLADLSLILSDDSVLEFIVSETKFSSKSSLGQSCADFQIHKASENFQNNVITLSRCSI